MNFAISSLLNELTPDPWRSEVGFSADIEDANQALFIPRITESGSVEILSEWLQKNQPCVFGRIAAKLGFIHYCILTEADLRLSDEAIEGKIQQSRLQWVKEGYDGKKSNFIILAVSPAISCAVPDQVVARIAQKLCSLYLRIDAKFDFIHHDHIFLEKPGPSRMTWRWLAGVNYFCAQGDKRWWQDHRIPGGMGFSINSVGHLVRSEKVSRMMKALSHELGIEDEEDWGDSKVDSLKKALVLAMQTISRASDAVSGRATELLTLTDPQERPDRPRCPVELPSSLADKDYCEYLGYYHTDYTLPSEYFLSNERRPESVEPYVLDFTYLFHKHIDNPDHSIMGEGQRIRADNMSGLKEDTYFDQPDDYKELRGKAESVPTERCDLLLKALSSGDQ